MMTTTTTTTAPADIKTYLFTLCGVCAALTAARRAPSDKQLAARTRAAAAMNAASRIYAEIVKADPRRRSRETWYFCLRQGWMEITDRETLRRLDTLADFFRLPPETQQRILRALAGKVPMEQSRRTVKDPETGEIKPAVSRVLWMEPRSRGGLELVPWSEALDMIANQTWIDARTHADHPRPEDPAPGIILARLAGNAAQRIGRIVRGGSSRHPGADPLPEDNTFRAAWTGPSPEAVILREDIQRYIIRDTLDRFILRRHRAGDDVRTIADTWSYLHPDTPVSKSTADRRLQAIRARLLDYLHND